MPLLGHALTGMTTSLLLAAAQQRRLQKEPSPVSGIPFLTTSLIIFSYIPDITTQLLYPLHWQDARVLAHSLIFAVVISPLLGIVFRKITDTNLKISILLILFSIILHDLLDILQSSDRQPLWPFSTIAVGSHCSIIPASPTREALFFLTIYLLAWIVLFLSGRYPAKRALFSSRRVLPWKAFIIVGIILSTALTCYHLRTQRIAEFKEALSCLSRHDYRRMLSFLDKADQWPGAGKPGRSNYFRGLAYLKLGDADAAEHFFLLSHRQDPDFIWSVADLAIVYASSDRSVAARIMLTRPLIAQLRKKVTSHPDLPANLKKIHNLLAASQNKKQLQSPSIAPPDKVIIDPEQVR